MMLAQDGLLPRQAVAEDLRHAQPAPLIGQLVVGARLVVPVGDLGWQTLTVAERTSDGLRTWTEGACRFVPLIGRYAFAEGR